MVETTNKLKGKSPAHEVELEMDNPEEQHEDKGSSEIEFDIVESKVPKQEKEKKEKKTKKKKVGLLKRILEDERTPKVAGLLSVLLAVFLFVSFISYLLTGKNDRATVYPFSWSNFFDSGIKAENLMGKMGAYASHLFIWNGYGIASFLFVSFFFLLGLNLVLRRNVFPIGKVVRHSTALLVIVSTALAFITAKTGFPYGGAFGAYVNDWLLGFFGQIGTGAILVFSLLTYSTIAFNLNFNFFLKKEMTEEEKIIARQTEEEERKNVPLVLDKKDAYILDPQNAVEEITNKPVKEISENVLDMEPESVAVDDNGFEEVEIQEEESSDEEDDLSLHIVETTEEKEAEEIIQPNISMEDYDPTLDLGDYKYPELDLLQNYGTEAITIDKDELERNKNQIITTLQNYDINISKIKATVGPTVTLYEIVPAPGVRISKIKNLEADIALSLAALGIRIIAPIPGKGTIGIEVPNLHRETVSMRTLLASEKFQTTKMDLPVALGKTISNEIFIADLAKMPHLLVAGATGQGKSVGINVLLTSLLYKKHPSQIKFVLIDPKMVELSLYQTIEKHFLAKLPGQENPIIVDTDKVIHTLKSLCLEMDLRLKLLMEAGCRNLNEYNEKFISRHLNPNKGHRYLPFIVLVVDEFGDLIMTAGKEIEMPITRLAQKARAIGIHLIIATQRPSVNIITGSIKANFPARIAFKVVSTMDSRTILDTGGADQLIGKGDMLISVGGELIRLQCAFVDTPEVEKVMNFIGSQRGYPQAHPLPEVPSEDGEGNDGFDPDDRDEFFEEAARLVVIHQQGSTSLIQRKMKLGYNRAGRLMDQLEQAGIVGPSQGSKARDVLIRDEMSLEQFLTSMSNKV